MSPLLFTLCLEYLSRILRVVTEKPEFKYHSLCRGLKLSHLAFADDLLLFCRSDMASITIILRAFLTFSEASGLCMNKAKSDMYLNGVDANLATQIVRLAGFKLGQFPIRYLGVPISFKRLSVADCNRVVDKIMHAYWARIFLLPKEVIHKVESICRNYLWAGHAEFKHTPFVAWETCCLPKEHGGLGIINCHLWNVALIGKYVWWIHIKKESLWVQWVHHIYIKKCDWWMYEPTQHSSWTWRQICKVKDILKSGFLNGAWNGKYSIQMGYRWLLGPYPKKDWDRLQKFGVSTFAVSDASADQVTGSVAGECAGLDSSLEVQITIEKADLYHCKPKDAGGLGLLDSHIWNVAAIGKLVWWLATKQDHLWIRWVDNIYLKGVPWMSYKPTEYSSWSWRKICDVKDTFKVGYVNGKWRGLDTLYHIADGYCWLMQGTTHKVPWHTLVWNRYNLPKWCFIMWLKQHQRLLTLDRLQKMGITDQDICFVCGLDPENHTHLFTECTYAIRCFQLLADWLHIPVGNLIDLNLLLKLRSHSLLSKRIIQAAVAGVVYGIWQNRNHCRVDGYVQLPEQLIQQVKLVCKRRVLGVYHGVMKAVDRQWCNGIGLSL
ncbi:uncharacterized protein LOC141614344 [Silene latifolia]|uniref:uncharacterized protein LOC141614344 n=1 Tax=Silene latifolia TaxID=37657 RepID=UPI003D7775A8